MPASAPLRPWTPYRRHRLRRGAPGRSASVSTCRRQLRERAFVEITWEIISSWNVLSIGEASNRLQWGNKKRERAFALSLFALWRMLEHHSERDRNELRRRPRGLNLGVAGLDEGVEAAQRHADSAARVPAEIVIVSAADAGYAGRRMAPAGATDGVGRDRRRRELVHEVSADSRIRDVAIDTTLEAEAVVRCVDPNPER